MPIGRPVASIELTSEEHSKLSALAGRRKSRQGDALRARIVLLAAEGRTNSEIAESEGISMPTVGKWRRQFHVDRLAGLYDAPRSGAPRTISDAKVEEIVTKTLESKPRARTHWSSRSMGKEAGVSSDTVQRIWKAFGLQPHRVEGFKLSTDPMFIEKVRDVVGIYLNPPEKAIVLCVDEKSQCQALERNQPNLPLRPGSTERQTHDYTRHGTVSLFAAYDAATGRIYGQCHRQHRSIEFVKFLNRLDRELPEEVPSIHIVLDNYATHKTPAVQKWLLRHPRYHLHFTPTSASWLNMVERFFAKITDEAIRRGSFSSVRQLEVAINEYLEMHNEDPMPFVWTKTADEIFAKLESGFLQ